MLSNIRILGFGVPSPSGKGFSPLFIYRFIIHDAHPPSGGNAVNLRASSAQWFKKVALSEKITDFGQKGVSWLEPAREFVLSLNQAANLLSQNNLPEMTAFMKNIGSNHILRNRQFVFDPKMQYVLTAERSEAAVSNLQFPIWCSNYTLRANFL